MITRCPIHQQNLVGLDSPEVSKDLQSSDSCQKLSNFSRHLWNYLGNYYLCSRDERNVLWWHRFCWSFPEISRDLPRCLEEFDSFLTAVRALEISGDLWRPTRFCRWCTPSGSVWKNNWISYTLYWSAQMNNRYPTLHLGQLRAIMDVFWCNPWQAE